MKNTTNSTDYFGKDADSLKSKRLFLLDMDGTIYQENTVFDGTRQMLDYIRDSGGRYVFITNNSSKSVKDYMDKVHQMGLPAEAENFFTSTQATILYLKEHFPDALVYCQGTKSMISELLHAGIRVTEEVRDGIDVVLVGFDMELTMQKLRNTCEILTCQSRLILLPIRMNAVRYRMEKQPDLCRTAAPCATESKRQPGSGLFSLESRSRQ